jgi:hypothetical protein
MKGGFHLTFIALWIEGIGDTQKKKRRRSKRHAEAWLKSDTLAAKYLARVHGAFRGNEGINC